MKLSALTIGLSIVIHPHATDEDIEMAHNAVDNYHKIIQARSPEGSVTSIQLQTEGSANSGQAAGAAATTQAAAGGVELDKDGVPWDAEIHSSNRKLTDKGIWTKRRGVDDALYRSKTAALKATVAAQPAATATTTLPTTSVTMPGAGVQLPGGAPTLPALTPAAPVQQPEYTELVALIGRNTVSPANPQGRIDAAWVETSLKALGVADGKLETLAVNPALVVSVLQQFKAAGLA